MEIILVLLEFFLALRFAMKFFSANPLAFVIKSLYALTDIVVWPFRFIFPNTYWQNHFIDVSAVSAMIGYLIVFLILLGLLKLLKKN